jgi:hypothetical protein
LPLAPGDDEIAYPGGELDSRKDLHHRANGIALPANALAELRRLGDELGLAPPCWRRRPRQAAAGPKETAWRSAIAPAQHRSEEAP